MLREILLDEIEYNDEELKEETAGIASIAAKRGRRSEEIVHLILYGLASGWGNKRIVRAVKEGFGKNIRTRTVEEYRIKYGNRIETMRKEIEEDTIRSGLVNRKGRTLRLTQLAIALEESILDENGKLRKGTDTKLITEYRNVIQQIGNEVGDNVEAFNALAGVSDEELLSFLKVKLKELEETKTELGEKSDE